MTRLGILVFTAVALAMLVPRSTAFANAPACYTYNGNGYCQYDGVISRAYVNSGNLILIYFDSPVTQSSLSAVGITGVSVYDACAYHTVENPEFAKMFFAAALAAQARGATVSIQLWGSVAGYLKCDRIWVPQ